MKTLTIHFHTLTLIRLLVNLVTLLFLQSFTFSHFVVVVVHLLLRVLEHAGHGIREWCNNPDRTDRTDRMQKVRTLTTKISPGPESLAQTEPNHSPYKKEIVHKASMTNYTFTNFCVNYTYHMIVQSPVDFEVALTEFFSQRRHLLMTINYTVAQWCRSPTFPTRRVAHPALCK